MGEHTPTPWAWYPEHCAMIGDNGNDVFWTPPGSYQGSGDINANAAFIVKAVNLHDELVAALRTVLNTNRGTSGRIILEISDEVPLKVLLAKAEA